MAASRETVSPMTRFAGGFEIQDEGSQLVALLAGAKPGQTVIDLCAGAGGKTLALAALMGNSGRLFATEPAFVDSLHLATVLAPFARSMYEVVAIGSLEGAWVKEAAQGAAIIADGLAGEPSRQAPWHRPAQAGVAYHHPKDVAPDDVRQESAARRFDFG